MSAVMEAGGKLWSLEWVQQGVGIVATSVPRRDHSIDLQARLDALAVRLRGEDRLLVFEASSAIRQRDERLAVIRSAVGRV